MRNWVILIAIWAGSILTYAEPLSMDVRLSFRSGAILPDGKADVMVGAKGQWVGPTLGGELALTFYPDWLSLYDWNQAGIGVALSYYHLGTHPLLGSAIAPYVYIDIPIVRLPHFVLGLRPGIGVAFMTKTYRSTAPKGHLYVDLTDANRCIGSVFNFHFPEAIYFEFPIRNGWSLLATAGWYHISNGSMVQPNSGYNILAGEIGARYQIPTSMSSPTLASRNTKEVYTSDNQTNRSSKPWEIEMAFVGGGRQVYYRDRETFFACAIQAAAYWRAHRIFRLGGGVDIFYDGAYVRRESYFQKTHLQAARADGGDCWRVGVSVQPEFVVGDFTAGFHFGLYLYDPVKELEPYDEAQASANGRLKKDIFYRYDLLKAGSAGYPDGWLYTQIVLRYRLPKHIFLQASMKAHLTKVEFVAAGMGVYL